jgi:hypothetical protein
MDLGKRTLKFDELLFLQIVVKDWGQRGEEDIFFKIPTTNQNGVVLPASLIFLFSKGYFSNYTLPKRRSFEFFIQFDGNN